MSRHRDLYRRTRRALRKGHAARAARREMPSAASTTDALFLRRYRGEVARRIEELEDAAFLGRPFVYQPPFLPVFVEREPHPLLMMPLPIERRLPAFLATITAVLAIALLPLSALAQTPTPEPPVRWELLSTIGTIVAAGDESKTPVVGMRMVVDGQVAGGLRAFLRGDLNRLSDGGAVDSGASLVPSYDAAIFYLGAYWSRGAFGLEVFVGQAFALSDRKLLLDSDPGIAGAGVRITLASGGYVFAGGGIHRATGKGARGLLSLILPIRGNTSLYLDGAAGSERKSVVCSGVAVRF